MSIVVMLFKVAKHYFIEKKRNTIFAFWNILLYLLYPWRFFIFCTYLNMPDTPADIGWWIGLDSECLTKWTCTLTINKTLQIKQDLSAEDDTLGTVVQDVFLWATFFIGTIATIGLIISGMMMVFWWASESQFEKWKTWFKYSLIGVLLVVFSYSMIRLVEYIAQGKL